METNKIICGAMPKATKVFPDGYFNCSISSPPYWALRDYGLPPSIWDGDINCKHKFSITAPPRRSRSEDDVENPNTIQASSMASSYNATNSQFCSKCNAWFGNLGLEPNFELYIKHLCDIYDEVKRILRDDGTCWVNLGDTYAGSPTGSLGGIFADRPSKIACMEQMEYRKKNPANYGVIQNKSLCLIPQRFAIEMVNRGWILRNVIIWKKPNPMPSSAKDRFTVDFEYVYFFVKSKKYWFEQQYEPHKEPWRSTGRIESSGPKAIEQIEKNINQGFGLAGKIPREYNPLGRHKRTVWTIPTQSFPEAHFATFPEKLVEPMIKAGCPEFVCTKCGKAREKVYEPTMTIKRNQTYDGKQKGQDKQFSHKRIQMLVKAGREAGLPHDNPVVPKTFKGYTDCGCNAEWRPGITLDCFCWVRDYFTGSCKIAA